MGQTQYSKLTTEIPGVDIVIKMGCNVVCPYLPAKYAEDWGLMDPTGKSDEVFNEVINKIEDNIKLLAEKIKNKAINI
jgi:arsenate reductase